MYGADVMNDKVQISLNFTTTFKFELFNLMKYSIEIQFVPILVELAIDSYTTSFLEDNCIWTYYNYRTFLYETRVSSNFKSCQYSLNTFGCEYDPISGQSTTKVLPLSGTIGKMLNGGKVTEYGTHCFGSATFLY